LNIISVLLIALCIQINLNFHNLREHFQENSANSEIQKDLVYLEIIFLPGK
jgi:hypothetical protein